ncbi:MAG: ATP-binding protein [Anaerolineae bacterium]
MTGSLDFLPQIDGAICIGCELCVKLCPTHALGMVNGVAAVLNKTACDYSSVCHEICPTQAIQLSYEILSPRGTKGGDAIDPTTKQLPT